MSIPFVVLSIGRGFMQLTVTKTLRETSDPSGTARYEQNNKPRTAPQAYDFHITI